MLKVNHEEYKEECKKMFSEMNDAEIIGSFNKEVGNTGWTTSRGIYLSCLENEMHNRLFDLSAISGNGLSFKKKIKLVNNKIVIDGK